MGEESSETVPARRRGRAVVVAVAMVAAAVAIGIPSLGTAHAAVGWSSAGSLVQYRYGHTSTLLPDGKVLIAGGSYADEHAEVYDPGTGTFTATPPMPSGHRNGHMAVLLGNGKVLVAGGQWPGTAYSALAELYDPVTNTWTPTGSMVLGRGNGPRASLLADGRVLVSGGSTNLPTEGSGTATAEIYDPATGTWALTGSMSALRDSHAQVRLPNGRVLAASGGIGGGATTSAEVWDPATGVWTTTGSMTTARSHPGSMSLLLPNGKVLVAGGHGGGDVSSAELYDWVTGTWSFTGSMTEPRAWAAMDLLPNGTVLVAGGFGVANAPAYNLATAEIYDPATGTWSATSSIPIGRQQPAGSVLASGSVLVSGGYNDWPLGSAYLYEPVGGGTTATTSTSTTSTTTTTAPTTTTTTASPMPTSADQCKKGGWRSFGVFRNQGDCVSWVVTNGRNSPRG